jgi:hypothetical protein
MMGSDLRSSNATTRRWDAYVDPLPLFFSVSTAIYLLFIQNNMFPTRKMISSRARASTNRLIVISSGSGQARRFYMNVHTRPSHSRMFDKRNPPKPPSNDSSYSKLVFPVILGLGLAYWKFADSDESKNDKQEADVVANDNKES